jgi:hypothetical protein
VLPKFSKPHFTLLSIGEPTIPFTIQAALYVVVHLIYYSGDDSCHRRKNVPTCSEINRGTMRFDPLTPKNGSKNAQNGSQQRTHLWSDASALHSETP